jgi:hypothetical protein
MTGLDKIIQVIEAEGKSKAESILAEANEEAEKIIASAKDEAEKNVPKLPKNLQMKSKLYLTVPSRRPHLLKDRCF